MEYITSRTNDLIVKYSKFSDKKFRDENKEFCFEGIKLYEEMLKSDIIPECVFVTENNISLLSSLSSDVKQYIVNESVYQKLSKENSPQGVFCVVKYLDKLHKFATIYNSTKKNAVFCLSSVRDPGNLGTIMRTALSFGIETLILSDDCADIYNSKTIRASMGAVFRLNTVRTVQLDKTIVSLQAEGYRTFAAALDETARRPIDISIDKMTCFVAGNEGHGLSEEIIAACQNTVFIPMRENCESLNVAMACGILMWEIYKSGL